jgi:hypothetical protein
MADWSCPQCRWVNREFAEACLSCGTKRPGDAERAAATRAPDAGTWELQGPPAMPRSLPMTMPMTGEASIAVQAPTRAGEPFGILGLPGGIIGAVVAAVIGSAVWYAVVAFSSLQIGFVAAAVGWLVGTGAVLGARGRGSVWLSAVSVVVTVLALGISEYLIAYHVVTRDLGIDFNLLQPPDVIADIVIGILQDDPVTLVFWAFAIAAAAYIPFKAISAAARSQPPVPDYPPDS